MQSELQKYFATSARLKIDLAEPSSETPADRVRSVQRERQERAVEAIEQDPFVREVTELFGTSVDASTIRPV